MRDRKIGFDCYVIDRCLIDVIQLCKKHNLHCYYVYMNRSSVNISFRLHDRNRVRAVFPCAVLLYTSGLSGMLFRNLKRKERVLSYLIVIGIWCTLSMIVFQVNIYGESDKIDQQMHHSLKNNMYEIKDAKKIKDKLLKQFHNQVSWLEVYEKGSIIKIRYSLKKELVSNIKGKDPLVAKKDGMIAYFKCDAGYKLKKINDVVKAGEVLVSNKMPNSFNQEVNIDVNGKVYAYVWQNVEVEMDENKLPEAINYYSMIFEARNEINIDLNNDEKVVKENILQFSKNKGKINLRILYTLLEDITS